MFFVLCTSAFADVKDTPSAPTNTADDFTLSDQDGKTWKLSDVLKDYRGVVLAFYPKDNTKG
jgi:peroxiredoxin